MNENTSIILSRGFLPPHRLVTHVVSSVTRLPYSEHCIYQTQNCRNHNDHDTQLKLWWKPLISTYILFHQLWIMNRKILGGTYDILVTLMASLLTQFHVV